MMHNMLAFITLFLALAFGSPLPSLSEATSLMNVTIQASTPVWFKFKPKITNAQCSGIYATSIEVRYTTDDFTLTSGCRDFIKIMGGVEAEPKVDVTFVCQGIPPKGTGEDEEKLKIVLFGQWTAFSDLDKDIKTVDVRLQATDIRKDKVVYAEASIAVRFDDDDGFTINELTC